MDTRSIGIAIFTLLGWGSGGFLAKLAADRIGNRSVFWDLIGYSIGTLLYTVLILRHGALSEGSRAGIGFAILAGFIGSCGGIGFYLLMARKDASVVAPLTALYPALTAMLAFVFLKESLTATKVIGILLASAAMILLSI